MSRARKRILCLVAGLLLFALIGEVALRIAGLPRAAISGWRARSHMPMEERNELGYRGHPIRYSDEDYVIVLLGDSQVEARTGTLYDRMPERLLELCLNELHGKRTRVLTVGAQAWGTDQELLGLREYFQRFRADMVVLWFTPRNDIWNNTFPSAASGHPKPTFWIEDGRLWGPTEGLGEPETGPPLRILALLRSQLGPTRDAAWEARLPPPYEPLEGYEGPLGEIETLWDTTTKMLGPEDLDTEKSHLSMYFTPASERLRYGLELTRRLVREVERESRSRGAEFVVFTTAIENSLVGREAAVVPWHDEHYRVSPDQFDANVRSVMEPFAGSILPVSVEDWSVSPRDKHLNHQAMEQVMDSLGQVLAPLVPDA